MTEIEAINIALQTIGEIPITTSTVIADVYEATIAESILAEVKREVLTKGMNCNTDTSWVLNADSSGYIALAGGILRLESSENQPYIMKDNKLYNKKDHTFLFTAGQSVKVDIVWDLDFDNLPHAIAYYIALKTARVTQSRLLGSGDIIKVLMHDEEQARLSMLEHDIDTSNYNIFDNSVNNRVKNRSSNPRGI
jgi:hypothetical protein